MPFPGVAGSLQHTPPSQVPEPSIFARIKRESAVLALLMGAFGTTAMAAPIIGSFSKSGGDAGSVRCVSLAGAVVGCGSAEAIDFGLEEGTAGESPTPGVAG